MNYCEYLKQFEGQECYVKKDPEDETMTVYFSTTQPDKTQYVKLHAVHDDFVIFLNTRVFDAEITYRYSYTCPLNLLYAELEEIVGSNPAGD